MTVAAAIVIVSYETREDLLRCLAALVASPPNRSHTIVVVDNASTDGSADAVGARHPRVTLVRRRENAGFAAAANEGIRATHSEFILLLNSDTLVPPGAIDRLIEVLEKRRDVAAVGPRLVDPNGVPEISFGRMITPLNELRQKFLTWAHAARVPGVRGYVEHLLSTEQRHDWLSGGCLLVRRSDAERVGLLDERFFLYGEDVDFCARLRAFGRSMLFLPSVVVVHARGRSVAFDRETAQAHYRRSHLAFYAKHHPGWLPWLRAYLRVRGQLPRS